MCAKFGLPQQLVSDKLRQYRFQETTMSRFEHPDYSEQPPSYSEVYRDGVNKGFGMDPSPPHADSQIPTVPCNDPGAGPQQTPVSATSDDNPVVGTHVYCYSQRVVHIVCRPDRSQQSVPEVRVPPPDLMWKAVLVSLFCCLPIGIMAIRNARRAKTLSQMGDVEDAKRKVKSARHLIVVGVACGIFLILFVPIVCLLVA